MKNQLLILVGFSISLVGCGDDKADVQNSGGPAKQDAELAPYLESFLNEAEKRGVNDVRATSENLTIEFANLEIPGTPALAGRCVMGNGQFRIQIDSDNWNSFLMTNDRSMREAVMYHELGHCLLGRQHTSVKAIDPVAQTMQPVSVMYPQAYMSNLVLEEDHDKIMDELFENRGH